MAIFNSYVKLPEGKCFLHVNICQHFEVPQSDPESIESSTGSETFLMGQSYWTPHALAVGWLIKLIRHSGQFEGNL